MSNPFEPYPHRPKASSTNARLPVQRLKAAGAPSAVVAEAERRWASADAEERARAREAFDALTDEELQAEMPTMEAGLALAAVVEDEDDFEPEFLEEATALIGEAERHGSTIEAARQYVGESRTKALAMLAAEHRRADTEQRKTLIDRLEAMVRGEHH